MTNTLKVKTTIACATCMCSLSRAKSFKVVATDAASAKLEAAAATEAWQASLGGQNCRVCASIIAEVG
ncbi:hypothetical protein KEM14_gp24 [Xanthomonas virus phiXaf18]|uniref:Uncharacterized protein n=1 Tax=Xanthomonas virus phiXaf18 TaxID=2653651 RepID=A0A5P8PQP7_9CAUD|nr:hypothetical protein KEM14_gp24 [Xanthomonas virus phiXaf18]QFR59585.1 hypothetical protein phiXaf18_24 [Xanthomonas virus phiXaf18]UGL62906.1 hypothetical protein [Xanthomonas phage MYK3]